MRRFAVYVPILILALGLFSLAAFAQRNPRGQASIDLSAGKVTIEYGRPSLRGRDIDALIEQVKASGKPWRLGADAATTLTTDVPLSIGGKTIPKGTHNLLARFVNKGQWNLVFSKSDWYGFKEEDVVLEIPMKVIEMKEPAEMVTMTLDKQGANRGKLSIAWGKYKAEAEFSAAKSGS